MFCFCNYSRIRYTYTSRIQKPIEQEVQSLTFFPYNTDAKIIWTLYFALMFRVL